MKIEKKSWNKILSTNEKGLCGSRFVVCVCEFFV